MKTNLFSKNKVQIISDNNKKSIKIKNIISKKILKNIKNKFNILFKMNDSMLSRTIEVYK